MKKKILLVVLVFLFALGLGPVQAQSQESPQIILGATESGTCVCNWSYCEPVIPYGDLCYSEPGPPWTCPPEAANCFYWREYLQHGTCTDTSSCLEPMSGIYIQCGSCYAGYGNASGEQSDGATCVSDCSGADNNQCGLK